MDLEIKELSKIIETSKNKFDVFKKENLTILLDNQCFVVKMQLFYEPYILILIYFVKFVSFLRTSM